MAEQEYDAFIDEVARQLKQPVRFDARLDARVMAALEPAVVPIAAGLRSAPWYRRRVSVSLVGSLAAAAAIAGLAAIGAFELASGRSSRVVLSPGVALTPVSNPGAGAAASDAQEIQFLLVAPGASSVSLVGQFNEWDERATPMALDENHGAWHVSVPLVPGLYQYQFLVDGKVRVTDPSAPVVGSEFGSPNSLLTVKTRE